MKPGGLERRDFLRAAGMGISVTMAKPSILLSSTGKPMAPDDFKERVRGPIFSFPTPYTADFKIDYKGIRNLIELGVKGGVEVFALTSGNNDYVNLTYEEVKELTRFVVETVAGRGSTLAAAGSWWTGQAVDYARFAESLGADAVQVTLPRHGDEDGHFEHFKQVAASTRLGLVVHGFPKLSLLKRLLAIDSVVAMKEEFTIGYTVPVYRLFRGRLNVFAGGGKARFLTYYPYGMQAYYSAFSTFAPEITKRFWTAVQKGQIQAAGEIVLKYDSPFLERFSGAFWRATLEYFGLAKRYVRPPQRTFSDQEMEEVKTFYEGLGLHPNKL